ncbi:Tfp pilus assembly protein PilO [Pseudoxanthomonas taiwanensis J19]|uniref:Tfp pilus assembly protein PilO n=2 Tax=Lysobacteraceae TaxID=32033 RepID=A0A562D5J0_9GAMM|nr:Tfp pilus assembly protein PilO [Pseudoxanthomonas taiwanensis J19]
MARINLLPWRAERRKQRQREFQAMLGAAALGGILLSILVWFHYDMEVSGQHQRNDFLRAEIGKVKEQNKEIAELDKKKKRLLDRKAVIEELQANRSQMVHLFDSLVRTIPDGVVLTALKQEGNILTLQGTAQSNARVSNYMRNLETSGWMTKPDLSIIEARKDNKAPMTSGARSLPYDFTLKVQLANPGADANGGQAIDPEALAAQAEAEAAGAPPGPGRGRRGAAGRRGRRGGRGPGEQAGGQRRGRTGVMSKKKVKLSELDFNNIGSWPQQAKVVFCVLVAIIIMAVAWFALISGKRDELLGLESEEASLRQEFEREQGRAANLEPLRQQLAQMEQVLQQMLRQLPSKTEMPDLIVDISQTALSSGLSNELFQPLDEMPREFYAEKPIRLRMVGNYHQFGAFVSGVASLPRVVILTMHDISLKPMERGGGVSRTGALELSGTVKTYRYLDENEISDVEGANANAGGR